MLLLISKEGAGREKNLVGGNVPNVGQQQEVGNPREGRLKVTSEKAGSGENMGWEKKNHCREKSFGGKKKSRT